MYMGNIGLGNTNFYLYLTYVYQHGYGLSGSNILPRSYHAA